MYAICNTDPNLAFICETQRWPLVHILDPFLFCFYFRDGVFIFFLIWLWEYIETLIGFSGSLGIFVTGLEENTQPETVGDSIISDGSMGTLGLLICLGMMRLLETPHLMPNDFPGLTLHDFLRWVKYFFQLLLFVVPTIWENYETSYGSVGYYIQIFWIPVWLLTCNYWNYKDTLCFYHTVYFPKGDGTVGRSVQYIPYPNQKAAHEKYTRDTFTVAAFLFIFMLTFFYDYSSMFVMGMVHGGFALFFFWGLWISKELHGATSGTYEQIPMFARRRRVG